MANIQYRGDQPQLGQQNSVTVGGTIANAQVYAVVINGKTVSYTASVGSDTNTTVAASLQALLSASTIPEFQEINWTVNALVITGTMIAVPGMPFANTSSATGTGTLVTATTVNGTGPSDISLAANYSTGSLPTNGDALYIEGTSVSLLYNLDALSAVTLASLTIDSTFLGSIGLPQWNPSGYWEYRVLYFEIGATLFNIVFGTGGGSQLIKINFGSVQTTANIAATGSSAVSGTPAIVLLGTHASNVLNITQGSVGSAIYPSEVSTWATINIGYQNSQQTDVTLYLGSGCTLTTINQSGGVLNLSAAVTTLTVRAGSSNIYGTGAITTLDVEIGSVSYQSNGTITTLTVGVAGSIDFSEDTRARTVTNATCYGTINDSEKSVTWTNAVSFPNGISGQNGATLDWGTNFHLQRS